MNKNKILSEKGSTSSSVTKKKTVKKEWQKPKLEDVSGKVMAQPYIRFT
ncbi:MAG: hypothetical protein ACE5WD_09095 [Candidatus Aminicenantia bacterium]